MKPAREPSAEERMFPDFDLEPLPCEDTGLSHMHPGLATTLEDPPKTTTLISSAQPTKPVLVVVLVFPTRHERGCVKAFFFFLSFLSLIRLSLNCIISLFFVCLGGPLLDNNLLLHAIGPRV
jgi:hypothetical protein